MTIFLNTELRKRLFSYVFTHSQEALYVRELASLIDVDVGNLSRELRVFEKEGIFHHTVKGKLKIYRLNKRYPLFNELKKIVLKTVGVEQKLRSVIKKYSGIVFACIYGSYAEDKATGMSDIDLLIVGDINISDFTDTIRKVESELNREINFSHYLRDEFKREKQKKGSFLNLVIIKKHIVLKNELKS